jgi:hypothetical protein
MLGQKPIDGQLMPVGTGHINVRVGIGHPANVSVGSGHRMKTDGAGHMNVRVGAGQIHVGGCAQIVIDGAPPAGAAASAPAASPPPTGGTGILSAPKESDTWQG